MFRPSAAAPLRRSLHTCRSSILAPAAATTQSTTVDLRSFRPASSQPAAPTPAPAAPKPRSPLPRHLQDRPARIEVAPIPKRLGNEVPWKVKRLANGRLPVQSAIGAHETSKQFLTVNNITGDVQSFLREVELFVGPMYTVKINSVQTVVEVHSTPSTKVTGQFIEKFKQWLIQIGM